jgi:signal transduction histidine kinase
MARPAVERAKATLGDADSQQNNSDASGQQSEWREVQQLRRKVDDLESLLEVNSHILSNVCHELRSTLTAVRGYTKRVLEERSGPINDAQRDDLAVVQKNARKLLDLASYSLPFIAEQQLRVELLDLREVWQHAARRLRFRLSEKDLTLQEHIAPGPVTVIADRARLETVFEIILANAVNCSSNGSEITAELSHGPDGEVNAKVLVPGAVLPTQVLERVFEHQHVPSVPEADPARPRLVGLSLAHDLVWLHGGRLAVRSVPEQGTVFAMTLPVPATKPAEPLTS